jgi:hypothetical protein
MKLNSKYFDSIRVGAKRDKEDEERAKQPVCQWKDCEKPGRYRAPQGRGRDGQYFLFCVDHVREYNNSYNYFDGMSDKDIQSYLKEERTGHRPTWKTGANAWAHGTQHGASTNRHAGKAGAKTQDPHDFFAWRAKQAREAPPETRRQLKPLEKKALETLHLPPAATKDQIKAQFKELVKKHHPDANGGDKRFEEKLREIIQAYNYLKQAGLV